MEPFYVRQIENPGDADAQRAWFLSCASEAKSEGANHARYSVSPDGRLLLTEAWKERRVPNEGEPRFFYVNG